MRSAGTERIRSSRVEICLCGLEMQFSCRNPVQRCGVGHLNWFSGSVERDEIQINLRRIEQIQRKLDCRRAEKEQRSGRLLTPGE